MNFVTIVSMGKTQMQHLTRYSRYDTWHTVGHTDVFGEWIDPPIHSEGLTFVPRGLDCHVPNNNNNKE